MESVKKEFKKQVFDRGVFIKCGRVVEVHEYLGCKMEVVK